MLNIIQRKPWIFIIFAGVLILILAILLVPKIAVRTSPGKQIEIYQKFLQSTVSQRNINSQEFWTFREFFSPGSFNFERRGFSSSQIGKMADIRTLPLVSKSDIFWFLSFNSPKQVSLEGLTSNSEIDLANLAANDMVLFKSPGEHIWKHDRYIYIAFEKPSQEMINANGFLDYEGKDKKLVEGKFWVVISRLSLD